MLPSPRFRPITMVCRPAFPDLLRMAVVLVAVLVPVRAAASDPEMVSATVRAVVRAPAAAFTRSAAAYPHLFRSTSRSLSTLKKLGRRSFRDRYCWQL